MSDYGATLLAVVVYKSMVIAAGSLSIYLGYRLFCRGVFDAAGDIEAAHGASKLVIRRAAPGTCFSLFGAAILGITTYRGVGFGYEEPSAVNAKDSARAISAAELYYPERPAPAVRLIGNPNSDPACDDTSTEAATQLRKALRSLSAAEVSVEHLSGAAARAWILQAPKSVAIDISNFSENSNSTDRIGQLESRVSALEQSLRPKKKFTGTGDVLPEFTFDANGQFKP